MTDSESKRTEYLRAQMSLGERVEVLERQVDRLKDRKVTVDWASMTTDKIDDLARRVAEIEKRVTGLDETMAASFTAEPGWSVSEGELARLRRIEEAARAVVDKAFSAQWVQREGAVIPALRAALDSEPKR